MDIFKFLNKKQGAKNMWLSIVASIAAIVVLINLNIGINRYLIYLLASVVSFISTMILIKKASRGLEEIIINEETIKVYFFNKMKDAVTIKKNEIATLLEDEKIVIKYKDSGKVIGAAHKRKMEEPHKWQNLVNLLKSSS